MEIKIIQSNVRRFTIDSDKIKIIETMFAYLNKYNLYEMNISHSVHFNSSGEEMIQNNFCWYIVRRMCLTRYK